MASVIPQCDAVVAHMAGVKAAVREEGTAVAGRARGLLASHHRTGDASIRVKRQDTDVVVEMVDAGGSAVAIELSGIRTKGRKKPQVIRGLFILTRAAGLPGRR